MLFAVFALTSSIINTADTEITQQHTRKNIVHFIYEQLLNKFTLHISYKMTSDC